MLSDSCACAQAALISSNGKHPCPSFRKHIPKYFIWVVFLFLQTFFFPSGSLINLLTGFFFPPLSYPSSAPFQGEQTSNSQLFSQVSLGRKQFYRMHLHVLNAERGLQQANHRGMQQNKCLGLWKLLLMLANLKKKKKEKKEKKERR